MDREAARWAGVVEQAGEGEPRLGAARGRRAAAGRRATALDAFVSADDSAGRQRSQLLAAALAGLGRINADQAARAGFRLGAEDRWTAAIDEAARRARAGRGRPARRRRHADRDLARRPARLSVPDRPRAARGRPGL